MRIVAYTGFVLGLFAVAALVLWQGVGPVGEALAALGAGVLLLLPVYAVYLAIGVVSWRMLFVPGREPAFWPALNAIWIGSSVNTLLPVATLGGEAVKARLLAHHGVAAAEASGSVVADTTVQALSLVLWGMIGVGLLAAAGTDADMLWGVVAASVLFGAGVVAFVVLQHRGMFAWLAGLVARMEARLPFDSGPAVDGLRRFDEHLREVYDRPGRVLASTLIRLASRIFLTSEIWIAAWLMGHPVTIFEAIMIRSLAGAVRGAAFIVPNGLGVQEGAYMLFGLVVGLPAEFSLSLSLAVRAREIVSSVPGLLVWQHIEGRNLLGLVRRGRPGPDL